MALGFTNRIVGPRMGLLETHQSRDGLYALVLANCPEICHPGSGPWYRAHVRSFGDALAALGGTDVVCAWQGKSRRCGGSQTSSLTSTPNWNDKDSAKTCKSTIKGQWFLKGIQALLLHCNCWPHRNYKIVFLIISSLGSQDKASV